MFIFPIFRLHNPLRHCNANNEGYCKQKIPFMFLHLIFTFRKPIIVLHRLEAYALRMQDNTGTFQELINFKDRTPV